MILEVAKVVISLNLYTIIFTIQPFELINVLFLQT